MRLSKSILLSALVLVALVQTALASIYSQLQFMKIESPRDGQDVKAGSQLTIKYVMQPLIDGKHLFYIVIDYYQFHLNGLYINVYIKYLNCNLFSSYITFRTNFPR